MQRQLNFLEDPPATESVWERMSEPQRNAAIEILARLIAQLAAAQPGKERDHD
jgi:hypothetical protein